MTRPQQQEFLETTLHEEFKRSVEIRLKTKTLKWQWVWSHGTLPSWCHYFKEFGQWRLSASIILPPFETSLMYLRSQPACTSNTCSNCYPLRLNGIEVLQWIRWLVLSKPTGLNIMNCLTHWLMVVSNGQIRWLILVTIVNDAMIVKRYCLVDLGCYQLKYDSY